MPPGTQLPLGWSQQLPGAHGRISCGFTGQGMKANSLFCLLGGYKCTQVCNLKLKLHLEAFLPSTITQTRTHVSMYKEEGV